MIGSAATRLQELLLEHGRARVPLPLLRTLAHQADPGLIAGDSRVRIRATLDELVAVGFIELPKGRSSWEQIGSPPLPKFVTVKLPKPEPRRRRRDIVWRAGLEWAADEQLTDDELTFLRRVQEFLSGAHERRTVPVKERSCELVDDEKMLEEMAAGSRFFRNGRLTLAALRCEPAPPPFPFAIINPEASILLVSENASGWRSMARAATRGGRIAAIAYGGGRQFEQAVLFVSELPMPILEIRYLGDIDPDGLAVPMAASLRSKANHLPAVRPAVGLYRAMIGARPNVSRRGPIAQETAETLSAWLPQDLRAAAVETMVAGRRFPQERIGADWLACRPDWEDCVSA